MNKIQNFLVKNYKTTVAAIIIAAAIWSKSEGWINENTVIFITSITTAIGFIFSKDADKTGTNN